jgi:hypothetical protein
MSTLDTISFSAKFMLQDTIQAFSAELTCSQPVVDEKHIESTGCFVCKNIALASILYYILLEDIAIESIAMSSS